MAGPIGIFAMAGEVGQQGAAAAGMAGALLNIFSFVALIAINLAGFFCLIALMVVVAVSDVNKLIL